MLSKSQIKLIISLQQKKYRNKYNLFIVEGKKSVLEFISSNFEIEKVFYTNEFKAFLSTDNKQLISASELKKISALKNPNQILGVFKIPITKSTLNSGLIVALDAVKDPGNLGTIIRLCDWFGIKQLVCSTKTVDCFNPKVVQASMGSLTRISIIYTNLVDYISKTDLPVFVSLMDGKNVYKTALPNDGILVMGNEANGISDAILNFASTKISIPRFGNLLQTESLNVATATAILLSEFRR